MDKKGKPNDCAEWLRGVELRPATPGDLPFLERMSAPFNENGRDSKSVRAWMVGPHDFGIIATKDGHVVGAAWWRLSPGGEAMAEFREPFLGIEETAQREGNGPCLLELLVICARSDPTIERLYAFPRSGDLHEKVVKILETRGFTRLDQTGLIEVRSGRPLPAWRLDVAETEPVWRPR